MVSDQASEPGRDRTPTEPDGLESVEAYETDNGIVFYDADNPLAWMEAGDTVSLEEHA